MLRNTVLAFVLVACSSKTDVPAPSKEAEKKLATTAAAETTVAAAAVKDAAEEGDCHHDDKAGEHHAEVIKRGDALKGDKAVALADLLVSPEKYDGQTVLTEGTIRQVCQKAGCWMELAATEKTAGARVTFKDYAFFVPKDAQKSAAKVEGTVKLAELSEARAKHYADEGATVPRGKDGKPREVQIVANGVEIRKN